MMKCNSCGLELADLGNHGTFVCITCRLAYNFFIKENKLVVSKLEVIFDG